jgi:type I restriction enzyme R subunit
MFLDTLGYTYVYAPDIARDYSDVFYSDVLLLSLRNVNPKLPESALSEVVYKLRNIESGDLLTRNKKFMDYLQNGVSVGFFEDGEERSALVYLIDYDHIDRNTFTVANQWTIIEHSEKRPDVIIFING